MGSLRIDKGPVILDVNGRLLLWLLLRGRSRAQASARETSASL